MQTKIRLTPTPDTLLAGVSGGADSVALLLLLQQQGKQVTAVHVNHGLRGAASDGDEAFVQELCQHLNVPLLTFRANPPEHPSENWAREARYAFFREAMAQTGAQALALAHHQDDQAETLLLHLLRGTGLTGLCGMAADTVQSDGLRIVRPLLGVSRQMLQDFLREQGQTWREDASNADPKYLRNALRHGALPMLERMAPGAARRMAETARLVREDEAVLDELTRRFMQQHGTGREMLLAPLLQEPPGLQRRILRVWWQRQGNTGDERSLTAAQTTVWLDLLAQPAGSRCNLPGGWHGLRGWTHMHLIAPETADAVPEQPLVGCGLVSVEGAEGDSDGRDAQAFPAAWLPELTLRTRRAGDWIRPFGMTGRQSLQDYLVNRRIDAPFRDRVPLVCRGSEVLWAIGVGAGGLPKKNEMTDAVLLRCVEYLPWSMKQSK